MILIASTLLLCMASVGHGNPMPDPNPDPNMIIQVRQVVHRRNCKKPHDQDGPFGHPTTEASVDDVTPVAQVDVGALVAAQQALNNSINEAQEELAVAQAEQEALEGEVAAEEADIAAVDDILGDLDSLFDFGRKRRSISENIKDFLGVLGNIIGGSHRNRRAASSDILTITYCPDEDGEITGTALFLFDKAVTDIKAALVVPRDIPLAICINGVLKDLKALGITFTKAEIDALKAKANEAKAQAESVKKEKEEALAVKEAQLAAKKVEVAAAEIAIDVLEEEKADIEDQIEAAVATPAPVLLTAPTSDLATTTDDIATTDDDE